MYQRLLNWLERETRYRGFFAILLTFPLALFIVFGYEALLMGFPEYKFLILFTIPLLLFLSLPVIWVLGEAYKNAAAKNEKLDLLYKCLTQIALIREGMEPGQQYRLTEGYTFYSSDIYEVKTLLEESLGEKVHISISVCSGEGPYSFTASLPVPDLPQELLP